MKCPPPNPHAAEARAAIMAHNASLRAHLSRPLYPLNERLPIWRYECNDAGCSIVIDDPANVGIDAVSELCNP
jgi:hypothetical protein